jgi:hypothetical protein
MVATAAQATDQELAGVRRMIAVRVLKILLTVVYASYLVNVGLVMLLLPWSELWSQVVLIAPYRVALVLDEPAVRGLLSAFGLLHLVLLVAEFVHPSVSNGFDPQRRG